MPWPLVTEADVPPAGRPGECFWCKAPVNTHHSPTCVTVRHKVTYDVTLNGAPLGVWVEEEPVSWGKGLCDSHKNDGTWCCDNAEDQGEWLSGKGRFLALMAEVQDAHGKGCCTCGSGIHFSARLPEDIE